ncbi:MAG: bifunctional lysylphosphatidylglycerol synthetase/lysine--tRNA ligase LysX [Mycobacteriales bacterium]
MSSATGTRRRRDPHIGHRRAQVAAFVGRFVTLGAAWSLISIPIHHLRWAERLDDAFAIFGIPAEPNLFVAALLLVLGSALRRRLHAAVLAAMLLEALSAVVSLPLIIASLPNGGSVGDYDVSRTDLTILIISTVISLVMVVVLWLIRADFPARLAAGSRRTAVVVFVGGLAASTIVTFLLSTAFPGELQSTPEKIRWAVRRALGIAAGPTRIDLHGHVGHHWIGVLAGLMSAIALVAAAAVFLRASRATQYLSAADELDARRLVLSSGERDSLGYFATRRDKAVIFAADRSAAITYRTVASVSLASADPIGPAAAWPGAIEAWLTDARVHGWLPAVLAASEQGAHAYVAAGLKAMALGDEAILEVDEFHLDGRTMRPVRQAVQRVHRAGYTVRVRRHADLSVEEVAGIESLAETWRGNETERGFSMALNRLGDPVDGRCVLATAHDATGAIRALQSFVPWGARGLSLDLMRRDPAAENGLTEFLVAGVIEAAHDLGIRRVSLNFAMFRAVFSNAEQVGAGPIVRLTNTALGLASRFWQIESLYRSNAKYLPAWTPRYLCYDSSLSLSRAAIAAGMAEGFIPSPKPVVRRAALEYIADNGTEHVTFTDAALQQEAELLAPTQLGPVRTEQERVRRAKIAVLEAAGQAAYPVSVPRTTTAGAIRGRHSGLAAGASTRQRVSVTGRIRALRDFGGVTFGTLIDEDGPIQAMLTATDTPARLRELWRRAVDLGDHVSVTGEVIASDKGELSVLVSEWLMAAKCLRALPDVHAGFTDPDARVRQRHVDLIVNPDSMAMLRMRSTAVSTLRAAFVARGFMEVETPMLQAIHGGATARPFRTHINAYDTDLYLRIAPELFLKRLAVGGMAKIFELNRNFRNEGADATHNPEFTSVEAYQAHADYNVMRDLTRELIIDVATGVHGEPVALRMRPDGATERVRLDVPWPVIGVHEAVSKATEEELTPESPAGLVKAVCAAHGIAPTRAATAGELVLELYDELVERHTVEPTFYYDFPVETSPLTRVHRCCPRLAERWDLVAFGAEIGTAYSELIDPIDQRARLTEQSLKAAAGDPEASELDEAFLAALEYALPPTGGLGLGVDRLVMMLTGGNIRSTLAFPFVRPDPR